MPDEPDVVQMQLRLRWNPDAVPEDLTYANYVQVTYTPEDFTLWFGRYAVPAWTDQPPDGVAEVTVESVGTVTLPLNLIGNLIPLLVRQKEAYESNFGEIPPHPNKPPWLKAQETAEHGT